MTSLSDLHHGTLSANDFDLWLNYRLVIFSSSTCGRCQKLASTPLNLSPLRAEWVNVDTADQLALQYDVQQLPCAILFRGARPIAREPATPASLATLVALARSGSHATATALSNQMMNNTGSNSAVVADLPTTPLKPITEEVTFSAQPNHHQLSNVHKIGIKSVINLRDPSESDFLHGEEHDVIDVAGLPYTLIPIDNADDIDAAVFDRVMEAIDKAPKPVLVHCRIGLCAGGLTLAREAIAAKASFSDFMLWCSDLNVPVSSKPQFYQTCMEKIGAAASASN